MLHKNSSAFRIIRVVHNRIDSLPEKERTRERTIQMVITYCRSEARRRRLGMGSAEHAAWLVEQLLPAGDVVPHDDLVAALLDAQEGLHREANREERDLESLEYLGLQDREDFAEPSRGSVDEGPRTWTRGGVRVPLS